MKFYSWSIEKELDGVKKYLGLIGKSMKIPKYIRRKRRLEILGDSRLLRRLTHQTRVLNHGAHDSLYLFAKRLISRYETFLQLILSRQEARDKTGTTLQFVFRLPFYIQNIQNKSSVQSAIYSSLKNIYKLTKPTIHHATFRASKNTFLLNEIGNNNKNFITSKNSVSSINESTKSIYINNVLSNSNLYTMHNTKKSLYYRQLQYSFSISENLANTYTLTPSSSFETFQPKSQREFQYILKNLKTVDMNSSSLNIQNYRPDTQKIFKHMLNYKSYQFNTNYYSHIKINSFGTFQSKSQRDLKNLKTVDMNSSSLNIQNYRPDTQKIFKHMLNYQHDQFNANYHPNIQSKIQKKYLETNLVKILNYQINHNHTGSKYTNLSNIINQYRFDDPTTPSYRQRHRSIQNTQYRNPVSPYNLSQILSVQQIFRSQTYQRVHAQIEMRNPLSRTFRVVNAPTLHPAFSIPQPSEQVTRERRTVPDTKPEITYKRQISTQHKPQENQGDPKIEPAISFNRTVRPLGIAEPPQNHMPFAIDDLANQVMQKIADKLKTEQERRGIFI